MTTYMTLEVVCASCGKKSEQLELGSTSEFGSMDLDLRPPRMRRSTMECWLQQCPHCGWVAQDLEEKVGDERQIMSSSAYVSIRRDKSIPKLARRFLCMSVIEAERGECAAAFSEALYAAWVADDVGHRQGARDWRLRAAELLRRKPIPTPELRVQLLDVLRRAGDWDAARALAVELKAEGLANPMDRIVAFQAEAIDREDAGCFTLEQVLAR